MGVLLLVIDVALVALLAVMTWLGLTGKFDQVNTPTPLTTPIPIMTRRTNLSPTLRTTLIPTQVNISAPLTPPIPTMFWPTMSPTLRLTIRPSLSPQKYFIQIGSALCIVRIRSTNNRPTTKYRHTSTNLVPELRIISIDLK